MLLPYREGQSPTRFIWSHNLANYGRIHITNIKPKSGHDS
jgi:hypothetical protein